jgi:hypothetical protein
MLTKNRITWALCQILWRKMHRRRPMRAPPVGPEKGPSVEVAAATTGGRGPSSGPLSGEGVRVGRLHTLGRAHGAAAENASWPPSVGGAGYFWAPATDRQTDERKKLSFARRELDSLNTCAPSARETPSECGAPRKTTDRHHRRSALARSHPLWLTCGCVSLPLVVVVLTPHAQKITAWWLGTFPYYTASFDFVETFFGPLYSDFKWSLKLLELPYTLKCNYRVTGLWGRDASWWIFFKSLFHSWKSSFFIPLKYFHFPQVFSN